MAKYDEIDMKETSMENNQTPHTPVDCKKNADSTAQRDKKPVKVKNNKGNENVLFNITQEEKEKKNQSKKKHNTYSKKMNKNGKSKASYCWWATPVAALCLVIVAFTAMLALKEYMAYAAFEVKVHSALDESFYEGVCVDNYEMTGFGLNDALDTFEERVEKKYRQISLCFEIGDEDVFLYTAEELGYQSNCSKVITEAWNYGRSGSLEERYRSINGVSTNKINFAVSRTLYDPQKLREVTDSVAKAYSKEKQEASIEGFDFATRTFSYTAEQTGTYVDADALYENACQALERGGGLITVNVITIEPETTLDSVQSRYGMITSAVTNASSSSNNRLINLNLACKAINGTILEPGETFSFNTVVGKRTKDKGYTVAPVYTNGEVGTDIGGGVCQVSTTLWNAAMKADCEIVERHAHSRPVSYVDKGKDATVSWDSQDMSFKNTTGRTLYIVAYLREDKRVVIEIYGEIMPDGNYIKIEAKTTRKIQPGDPVRVYNPQLSKYEEVVVSEARTGYKAEAYRVYYDANDVELKRELLCTSYYKEAAARIEYGG